MLGDAARVLDVEVHAYACMPNHYHLLLHSRHGNLSCVIKYINSHDTQRLNRLHKWDGLVFRGRFHSQLVRQETALPYLLAYIHLNPMRAGLVKRLDALMLPTQRQIAQMLESTPTQVSNTLRRADVGASTMNRWRSELQCLLNDK